MPPEIVAVTGEVTFSNVGELNRRLEAALDGEAQHLVVDLTDVTFIDSSGLSALLTASAQARERGGGVALVLGRRRAAVDLPLPRRRPPARALPQPRGRAGRPGVAPTRDLGPRSSGRRARGAPRWSPCGSGWCSPAAVRAAPTRRARCPCCIPALAARGERVEIVCGTSVGGINAASRRRGRGAAGVRAGGASSSTTGARCARAT